jgi:hypothetical protein
MEMGYKSALVNKRKLNVWVTKITPKRRRGKKVSGLAALLAVCLWEDICISMEAASMVMAYKKSQK